LCVCVTFICVIIRVEYEKIVLSKMKPIFFQDICEEFYKLDDP
jgi:hypothetical protein